MRQEKVLLGNVKGPTGDPGAITSASADVGTRVGEPTVSVELSGPPNDRAIAFHFDGLAGLPASIVSADADTDGTCMESPELSVDVDELGSGEHNLHFHLNGIRGVPGYFSSVTTEVEDVEIDKPEVVASIGGDAGDQSLDLLFRGMRGPSGLDAEIVSADADTDGVCEDEPNITVDVDNLGFGRHSLHFHMDGMRGKPGYFTSANAEFEDVELAHPTCDVTVGGEPGAQTLEFLFKGLRGPAGRDAAIQSVTAVVDNTHSDEPACTVVLTGEPGDYQMEFRFSGIMGLPGPVATAEVAGAVRPDGSTITVDGHGTITAVTATSDGVGVVRPDGDTIEVAEDGTISARKLSGVSVGDSLNPVYLSEGVPTAVGRSGPGNAFGVVPAVAGDGSMDVGSSVDFHSEDSSESDFDVRVKTPDEVTRVTVELPSRDGKLALLSDLDSISARGCVAMGSGMEGNEPWHRFASAVLSLDTEARLVLHVRVLSGTDSFGGVLVASAVGGESVSGDLVWEVVNRGVPLDGFTLALSESEAALWCRCDDDTGWAFDVMAESSSDGRSGDVWELSDSIDDGQAEPVGGSMVDARAVTVLNNAVSATRLRDLDLDGTDLDAVSGCRWWNRMGWAKAGNSCLNLPPDVDSFGILVFRTGVDSTAQLVIGAERNCTYVRQSVDGTWGDWDRIHPPLDEKSIRWMAPEELYPSEAPQMYVRVPKIEVGTFRTTTSGWRRIDFKGAFDEPPVVTVTMVNTTSSYAYSVRDVDETGFSFYTNVSDRYDVNYMAMQSEYASTPTEEMLT